MYKSQVPDKSPDPILRRKKYPVGFEQSTSMVKAFIVSMSILTLQVRNDYIFFVSDYSFLKAKKTILTETFLCFFIRNISHHI